MNTSNNAALEPHAGERPRILLVEDDPNSRDGLEEFLRQEGFRVTPAGSLSEARSAISAEDFDLFLLDLNLPDGSGLDLAREGIASDPELVVIIITAYGTVSTAVQAMKEGVYDYIQKPIASMDELVLIIRKGLEARSLKQENLTLKTELLSRYSFRGIVGDSGALQAVLKKVHRVSRTNAAVLIRGESGTGKELVARAIHFNSPRKDFPFVTINCPSFPESLLESELFGHRKGSFTGAHKDKRGLFETADKGTLFLDEIGELNPAVQAKLLRFLEEKSFVKIGDEGESRVDVRIIAATNRNLEEAVKAEKFRQDLYYRLSVVPIVIPPLRERAGDVPLLVEHFMEKFSRDTGIEPKRFSAETLKILQSYSWPGNVRELQNLVENILITCDGSVVTEDMLPIRFASETRDAAAEDGSSARLGALMDRYEKEILKEILEEVAGNRPAAAERLGISVRTLQYKLKKHGLR